MKLRFRQVLIRIYMESKGITLTEFCELCGITEKAYWGIINEENCNVFTLIKIARVLHLDILQLFEEVE